MTSATSRSSAGSKPKRNVPFDLSAGHLLRCDAAPCWRRRTCSDLDDVTTALADAWSMGILTREIWTLYEAFSNGKSSPFERLPVQYSDYAVWQRDWLQGEVLDTQLDYWKKQLETLSILNLPTDRPRPPRQSYHGARVAHQVAANLTSIFKRIDPIALQ